MSKKTFLVAAAQVPPAFLDLQGTVKIAEQWIAEAGRKGISLLVFPETWLPGYPVWVDSAPSSAMWGNPQTKALYRRLFDNSPTMDGPEIAAICHAAKQASVMVVMGINEKDGSTLYNTLIYISPEGQLLAKHRKLVPTYTERLVHGRGDGSTLKAVDSVMGKVGGLVCWEHWMPLARMAMHNQDEVVHVAVWPTVNEAHLVGSKAYAFEGRTFVVACGSVLKREHFPSGIPMLDEMPGDQFQFGGSAIIGPDGKCLAGPAGDEVGLVIAEIDPGRVTEEKMALDICGHYSRPDVFRLEVDEREKTGQVSSKL